MKRLIVAAAAAAVLIAPGVASAADITGAWKLKVDVGGMMIDVACTFAQSGAALTGSCARTGEGAESPAALTGSVEGATAKWAYDVKFQDMPLHIAYTGNVKSDSAMDGALDVAGGQGAFTATKQ